MGDRVPVFVDDSGRRRRYAVWAGRTIAGVVVLYTVVVAGSLARAPWVPRIAVPGVGDLVPRPHSSDLGPNAVGTPAPDLQAGSGGPVPVVATSVVGAASTVAAPRTGPPTPTTSRLQGPPTTFQAVSTTAPASSTTATIIRGTTTTNRNPHNTTSTTAVHGRSTSTVP